jgi:hypothetical protein
MLLRYDVGFVVDQKSKLTSQRNIKQKRLSLVQRSNGKEEMSNSIEMPGDKIFTRSST